MKRNLSYALLGIVFGLALTKGEAINWFRIQEMFHFQSIHMYGIFMTAVPIGALSIFLIKRLKLRTVDGEEIHAPKKQYHHGIVIGSLIFGFGWALTGACPGPLYALLGSGYTVTLVTFTSALLGTWVYAWVLPQLPD
jgi:uncharacterized membrane protein YedE/YeeE